MLQVEQIAAQIREADCFLIGIGEAFAVGTKAEQSPLGKAYMENKKRLEGEAALLPAEREYVEILDMVDRGEFIDYPKSFLAFLFDMRGTFGFCTK